MGLAGFSVLFIVLNVAIFFVAVSLIVFVYPIRKWLLAKWLIIFLASLCLISFCSISVYANHIYEIKVMFSRLRYLGLAILVPSWLLFLSAAFQSWRWLHKRGVVALLFAPAVGTIFCTLFPPYRDLVIKNFAPIEVLGLSVVSFQAGSWFPVHYLWSVILTVASFALGFTVLLRGTSVQRQQVLILLAGSFISLACDIYCVSAGSDLRWVMLPAGTYLFTELAVAYGVFRYRLLASAVLDMQNVYTHVADPVVVVNDDERLVSFNHAARGVFHLTDEMIGGLLKDLIPLRVRGNDEFEFVDINGNSRFFGRSQKQISPGPDSPGSVIFFREVTVHIETEKRLTENIEFRTRLMSLIAHDMFGHIQNQAHLSEALKKEVPSGAQEVATMLTSSAAASRDLMRNILTWAKTQDRAFEVLNRPFEINVLIDEVIEELAPLFESHGVKISFVSEKRPWVVPGDSQMIGTALRNLLTNALRASQSGQVVVVILESEPSAYRITVKDEGAGMSPAQVLGLLDPTQAKTMSESKKHGFGIGFTLVQQFIELHNGKLNIDSTLEKGTRVSFSIPL